MMKTTMVMAAAFAAATGLAADEIEKL